MIVRLFAVECTEPVAVECHRFSVAAETPGGARVAASFTGWGRVILSDPDGRTRTVDVCPPCMLVRTPQSGPVGSTTRNQSAAVNPGPDRHAGEDPAADAAAIEVRAAQKRSHPSYTDPEE